MTSVLGDFLWGKGGTGIYTDHHRTMSQVIKRDGCSTVGAVQTRFHLSQEGEDVYVADKGKRHCGQWKDWSPGSMMCWGMLGKPQVAR